MRVLGLNCGTSVDGIDCVLCDIVAEEQNGLILEIIAYAEYPMSIEVKALVLKVCKENRAKMEEICDLNFALGREFANAARSFINDNGLKPGEDIHLIASHGQTLWHIPYPSKGHFKSTLQMAATGLTVVSDFRVGDVAEGRQGAPLVAFLDAAVMCHPTRTRVAQNIGGIANCTIVPALADGGVFKSIEFDTGPGNVLIDAAMRIITNGEKQYDKDGSLGSQGTVNQKIVDKVLGYDYFKKPLPKTTGREVFSDGMAASLVQEMRLQGDSDAVIIATITQITSRSIVEALQKSHPGPIHDLMLCGGGAFNPNIVTYIQEQLPQTKVGLFDSTGIPAGAKEAVSFAVLGHECLIGRPILVPSQVESNTPAILGKITPSRNYRAVMEMAMRTTTDRDNVCQRIHVKN